MKIFRCCICKNIFEGYGNNPAPLKNKGRCCDTCDDLVIAERIRFIMMKGGANDGSKD